MILVHIHHPCWRVGAVAKPGGNVAAATIHGEKSDKNKVCFRMSTLSSLLNMLEASMADTSKTAFFSAIQTNNLSTVNEYLTKEPRIDVNSVNSKGRTGLHLAAQAGHLAIVKRLLEEPAIDVNKADPAGFTPLMAAAVGPGPDEARTEVLEALVTAGANPNAAMPETGMTAAHYLLFHTNDPFNPGIVLLKSKTGMLTRQLLTDLSFALLNAAPPAVANPIFTFVGHGGEAMCEMGAANEGCLDPRREKMLPGRILLVAAECGKYSFWANEVAKAVQYGAVDSAEKRALFQELFSADKKKAGDALKHIEDAMGIPLHMFREGDEYPEISVSFDENFKSGLYLNPLKQSNFLQADGKFKPSVSSDVYFADCLFPTQAGVEKLRKIAAPLPLSSISPIKQMMQIQGGATSLGHLMDVFGPGVYVFPGCRDLMGFRNIRTAFNTKFGYEANILGQIKKFKNLPNNNAKISNLPESYFTTMIANAETKIPRIRRKSINQQSQYRPEGPVGGAGSTRRFRKRGGRKRTTRKTRK